VRVGVSRWTTQATVAKPEPARSSVADAGGERQGLSSSTGGSHAALLRRPGA
jgi:hypothetical protein